MNQINLIVPHRNQGIWEFSDPDRNLLNEPFIGEVNTIIDLMVKDIPKADKGFRLFFSSDPFINYQHYFEHSVEQGGGNCYKMTEEPYLEGWLCPALKKYFNQPPKTLYVKVESL